MIGQFLGMECCAQVSSRYLGERALRDEPNSGCVGDYSTSESIEFDKFDKVRQEIKFDRPCRAKRKVKNLSDKLQKLQNRAARIITNSSFDTSASLLLNLLDLDNLSTRRKKQLALAMFKSLHGLLPSYLQNLFVPCDPVYNLRNMENKLSLPKPRTNYLKHGFGYCGAALWNSLPPDLRSADSLSTFKRKLSITF